LTRRGKVNTNSQIGENPAPGAHELASFQLQLKTAALVRAAQALRDTAHELRLALVLGDDLGNVVRRDAEALGARAEVDKLRAALAREVGRIVAGVPVGEGEEEEAKAGEAQRKAEVEMKDESVKEPAAAEQSMPAEEKKDEAMDVDDEDEDEFEEV
jgi:mediator of RNA polymerase II transcription subunit 22